MNRSIIILFSLLLFYVPVGCDSVFSKNKLTREKARDIIQKTIFNQDGRIDIVGMLKVGGPMFIVDKNDVKIIYDLQKEDYISVERFAPSGMVNEPQYRISVKDKGSKYIVKRNDVSGLGTKEWNFIVKLGVLELNDITGINLSDENRIANVEFDYKYKVNTLFGEKWYEGGLNGSMMYRADLVPQYLSNKLYEMRMKFDYKIRELKLQKANVKMVLYDDGWRVAKRQ